MREHLARVEMEFARAKFELKRAESLRQQALVALAAAMGDAALSVKSLAGTLDETFEIPTLEGVATNLSAQPEILQAAADHRAQDSFGIAAGGENLQAWPVITPWQTILWVQWSSAAPRQRTA